MFYKVYHNIVAIPLPQYIQAPNRFTRHMNSLYLQKVQTGSLYHYHSFSNTASHYGTSSQLISLPYRILRSLRGQW
ncbi:hypothetical protein DPMN_181284 [Dreissena polymorpha]|uniref:Uncharacterized protein n=1 Tax=Dreissena polymorpha TaxID=45954 RepID=A0A9D4DC22_DREPO|nr:hypothetical protein DPMN_181284 [Dreissena polymorpha]